MGKKAYFGLPLWASIILAIFFGPFLGIFVRFGRGKTLWGVLNLVGVLLGIGIIIFWFVDLISLIIHKDLKWAA